MTTVTDQLASVDKSIEKALDALRSETIDDDVDELSNIIAVAKGHLDDAESELNEARAML